MTKTIIAPSVLSLDFSDVEKQIGEVNKSKAEWLHYDVMDGNFVPNISFGPYVMSCLKKITDKVFDVHLMVKDPVYYTDVFLKENAEYITFHYEAMDNEGDIISLAKHIRENNCKSGISIKPGTDVKVLDSVIEHFDLVLVMSVEPGFGGQKFNKSAVAKIKLISDMIKNKNLETLIQVDGGINAGTAALCKNAGANVLVAGSYVFKADIVERVESLL